MSARLGLKKQIIEMKLENFAKTSLVLDYLGLG